MLLEFESMDDMGNPDLAVTPENRTICSPSDPVGVLASPTEVDCLPMER